MVQAGRRGPVPGCVNEHLEVYEIASKLGYFFSMLAYPLHSCNVAQFRRACRDVHGMGVSEAVKL